jgi:hypothetical protein
MMDAKETFFRLVREVLTKEWPAEKAAQSVAGFSMREHVDLEHPDQVEQVAELATLPLPPEAREAWLFGYRFCDTPPADPESTL